MAWTRRARTDDSVVVRRVGDTLWILRPTDAFRDRTVLALRDAFLEAADSGAQNVIVDLSDAGTIADEGAAMLVVMAELMLGRGGMLWVTVRRGNGLVHALRPIESCALEAFAGLTPVLDAALERIAAAASDPLLPVNGLRKPSHDADRPVTKLGAPLRRRT